MSKVILILVLGAALAACGPKGKPPDDPLPDGDGERDGRAQTEIEIRRDAACETLGPRITACAIEDARKTMTPAELAELDPEQVAPVHTREFINDCKQRTLSSRQVRVYEVCPKEETECEALIACLANAEPTADEAASK